MREIKYASGRMGYFGAVTLLGVLAFLKVVIMARRAGTWVDWLDVATVLLAITFIWVSSFRHLRALDRLETSLENRVLVGLSADAFRMAFFAYVLVFVAPRALR